MSPHTSGHWRRVAHAAFLAAAGAIAACAMMLTAPVGNAIPESTIISECDSAGGTYTTTVADGKKYSKCCYRDINGVKSCDNYVDGTYTNTTANLVVDQPQSSPPPPPPPADAVGPPAPAEAAETQPARPDFGNPSMTLWTRPPPAP